jgi:hypothetical protein
MGPEISPPQGEALPSTVRLAAAAAEERTWTPGWSLHHSPDEDESAIDRIYAAWAEVANAILQRRREST